MDFSRYSEGIQNLTRIILKKRCISHDQVMDCCHKLIALGQEKEDSYLLGFAYYYLAEAYFMGNDYNRFAEALAVSIEHQQKAAQWELLTRAYNMLGVSAQTQGNITMALDHYLMALKYAEDNGFDYEKAMVYTNIGHIYMLQQNYIYALKYFIMGRELFVQEDKNPFSISNIVLNDIAMGRCYLYLEDLEQAAGCEQRIRENESRLAEEDYSRIPIMCFHARIAYARGESQVYKEYIHKVSDILGECTSLLDIYVDIMDFGMFLLKKNMLAEYSEIMRKVESIANEMGIIKPKISLMRMRIMYYEKIKDRCSYLEACAGLYELENLYEEETIRVVRSSTQLRFRLEEAKRKEEKLLQEKLALTQKSETDALTGLPNRYKINDYTDQIFEKARRFGKSLGIAMVDIDYFKEYNDTYGHQAGDEAIIVLAQCLKAVTQNRDIFCARFGGDEFVMVYYDKTDAEILETAAQLKEKLIQKKVRHKGSKISEYMTISQGIRNTVPRTENKAWDYLFSADTALYEMKKNGRNGIYLVHRMTAEGIDTVMLKDDEGKIRERDSNDI